jgi:hypothetical protein
VSNMRGSAPENLYSLPGHVWHSGAPLSPKVAGGSGWGGVHQRIGVGTGMYFFRAGAPGSAIEIHPPLFVVEDPYCPSDGAVATLGVAKAPRRPRNRADPTGSDSVEASGADDKGETPPASPGVDGRPSGVRNARATPFAAGP